jgi:hypothetical protein
MCSGRVSNFYSTNSIRHFTFAIITKISTEIVTSTNGTCHMISERTTDGHLKPSKLLKKMQNNEPLCSDRSSTIDVSSISSLTVSWFSLSSLKKQINSIFLFQTVSSNKYTTNHLFVSYWTDFLNSKHRLWCVHMSLRSMLRLYISLGFVILHFFYN